MEYLKISFTVVLAVVGWLVAHYFTSKRDTANSRRAVRIDALSACYKVFVRSGIDGVMLKKDKAGNLINNAIPIEDAVALIHLYGSQEQSDMASAYAKQVADTSTGTSTALVNSLRWDIRRMLGQPDLSLEPTYLRVTPNEPI
jgi:hypothetical protein